MTPQEASEWLRSCASVGVPAEIADLIDELAAARQLGPEVTLDQLKPSRNYFVVRDDDVVVVGDTREDKKPRWPDERLTDGYGVTGYGQDSSRIRSIHEIPAGWFPAAPPAKTELEPWQVSLLEKINAAIDNTLMSTGMHEVLKARIAAIVEGAK